ncbi:V-set and transmembrane domain-containing protein 2B [Aplochiton taeniatus]
MPCAFHASGPSARSLEIQWWYLKGTSSKELPQELQISAPANGFKVNPKEATKISAVRVQGNVISHRLSLFKVRKEDEGFYECRVSNLWAEEAWPFKVQARLRIRPRDGMLAEEAVSHIENRSPLRKSNKASAGVSSEKSRVGLGNPWRPHQAGPGLLPTNMPNTATLVSPSSASSHPGHWAILLQQPKTGSGVMGNINPLFLITIVVLHKTLQFILAL